jgi:hypothetical protein
MKFEPMTTGRGTLRKKEPVDAWNRRGRDNACEKAVSRPGIFKVLVHLLHMRKLIDIPNDLVKDLRILAAHADKDVKNYVQDLVIEHIKKNKKK